MESKIATTLTLRCYPSPRLAANPPLTLTLLLLPTQRRILTKPSQKEWRQTPISISSLTSHTKKDSPKRKTTSCHSRKSSTLGTSKATSMALLSRMRAAQTPQVTTAVMAALVTEAAVMAIIAMEAKATAVLATIVTVAPDTAVVAKATIVMTHMVTMAMEATAMTATVAKATTATTATVVQATTATDTLGTAAQTTTTVAIIAQATITIQAQ